MSVSSSWDMCTAVLNVQHRAWHSERTWPRGFRYLEWWVQQGGGVCVFKVGSPISVLIKTLTLYKLVLRPSCFQRDLSKELMG